MGLLVVAVLSAAPFAASLLLLDDASAPPALEHEWMWDDLYNYHAPVRKAGPQPQRRRLKTRKAWDVRQTALRTRTLTSPTPTPVTLSVTTPNVTSRHVTSRHVTT